MNKEKENINIVNLFDDDIEESKDVEKEESKKVVTEGFSSNELDEIKHSLEEEEDSYDQNELDIIEMDDEEEGMEDEAKNLIFRFAQYFCVVVLVCSIFFLILNCVVQRTVLEGTSMEPALEDGNQILVNKLSSYFSNPDRFDIVIFTYDRQNHQNLIKRVIGLPGETVQIIDGYVYINGSKLTTDVYGTEPMNQAGIASEPITLGEDEYFVLGDNRNISADSRKKEIGLIHKKQIIGDQVFRIWPLSELGSVK